MCDSGRSANVIACEAPIGSAVVCQGAGWSKDAGGGRGLDREDGRRKSIMGASLSSDRELEIPVLPRAATASRPRCSSPNEAPVHVADQSSTPESVDQDESTDSELMELEQLFGKLNAERLRADSCEIMAVLRQLGGSGHQYARDR